MNENDNKDNVLKYASGGDLFYKEEAIEIRVVDPRNTNGNFDDLYGNHELKEQMGMIAEQYKNREFFLDRGIKPNYKILLSGPFGVEKVLPVEMLASNLNRRLFHIRCIDMLNKQVDNPEEKLHKMFNKAKPPCILLLEGVENIAMKKEKANEIIKGTLRALLQEMDILEASSDIMLILTTEKPEELDKSLFAEHRIDKMIKINLPDRDDRKENFMVLINKYNKSKVPSFGAEINYDKIAKYSDGMTNKDIRDVVKGIVERFSYQKLHGGNAEFIDTSYIIKEIELFMDKKEEEEEEQENQNQI